MGEGTARPRHRSSPFIQSTTWLGDHLLTGSMMRAMGGSGARGSGGRRSPGSGRGCAGRRDRVARNPAGGRREPLYPRLPSLRSLARRLCASLGISVHVAGSAGRGRRRRREGGEGGGTLRRLPPPRTRGQRRRRLPAPPRGRSLAAASGALARLCPLPCPAAPAALRGRGCRAGVFFSWRK